MAIQKENPYVGPRTYEEKDADLFFGRDREARDLLSLIISEPLVLFYAESGAGKSSLLNAKILPGLRNEGYFVLPVARVGGELPDGVDGSAIDNIFTFNLLASIYQERQDPQALAGTTLDAYISRTSEGQDGDPGPRVLIIDQFEEILTTHVDRWGEREAFFEQLGRLIREDPLLWIVLTMREDYVAALDPFAHLLPGKLRARFYMQRMEAAAAQEAIEEPASRAGRPFAAGVARSLIDNLRQIRSEQQQLVLGQYVEPVQLQVVCYQLWENLKGTAKPEITAGDVDQLGDVDTALAAFYEQAIGAVIAAANISEVALRNWFERRLITEADTRGTVYQGTQDTAGLPNEVVSLLESKFIIRAEIRAGGTWYELIHDRFIPPILRANQQWRLTQSPLLRTAEEWDRHERDPSLLYRNEQLKNALAGLNRDQAEPLIQEFLTASEQAQSQRDIGRVQQEAQEQARRAEAEAQIARRLRWLAVALAAFVIAAIFAAISGFRLAQAAQIQSDTALAEQATAEADAQIAMNLQSTAEARSTDAFIQQATAEIEAEQAADEAAAGQAIAAAAQATADASQATAIAAVADAETASAAFEATRTSINSLLRGVQTELLAALIPQIIEENYDTELALLLGVEAYNINQALGGDDQALIDIQLRRALALPDFNTSLTQTAGTTSLQALADGRVLVTGLSTGVLRLWNLQTPGDRPLDIEGHAAAVTALALHPSGDYLATGDETGRILIWEVTSGAEGAVRDLTVIHDLDAHEDAVLALNFNRDGSGLASGSGDFTFTLWDTSLLPATAPGGVTVEDAGGQTFHNGPIFGVSYLPNGQILSASRNRIILWNRFGENPTFERFIATQLGFTDSLVVTADGTNFAVGIRDQGFYVFRTADVRSGNQQPFRAFDEGQTAVALTFQAGIRPPRIASAGQDRIVRTWQVFTNQLASQKSFPPQDGLDIEHLQFVEIDGETRLAAAGPGARVRIWELEGADPGAAVPPGLENLPGLIEAACARVQRNMTLEEWESFLPGEPYRATCPNRPPHFTAAPSS